VHYTKELTVPANTGAGTPASTTIDLPAGVLQRITIFFPPGCSRLTHVTIYDGATQVYPKTASTDYAEDAKEVVINDMVIYDAVKTLTLKGWSPGTSYQHKVTFNFQVQTAEELSMSRTGYY
jgi:hypothetical protein